MLRQAGGNGEPDSDVRIFRLGHDIVGIHIECERMPESQGEHTRKTIIILDNDILLVNISFLERGEVGQSHCDLAPVIPRG